jgi:hypothetical protein
MLQVAGRLHSRERHACPPAASRRTECRSDIRGKLIEVGVDRCLPRKEPELPSSNRCLPRNQHSDRLTSPRNHDSLSGFHSLQEAGQLRLRFVDIHLSHGLMLANQIAMINCQERHRKTGNDITCTGASHARGPLHRRWTVFGGVTAANRASVAGSRTRSKRLAISSFRSPGEIVMRGSSGVRAPEAGDADCWPARR